VIRLLLLLLLLTPAPLRLRVFAVFYCTAAFVSLAADTVDTVADNTVYIQL